MLEPARLEVKEVAKGYSRATITDPNGDRWSSDTVLGSNQLYGPFLFDTDVEVTVNRGVIVVIPADVEADPRPAKEAATIGVERDKEFFLLVRRSASFTVRYASVA